MTDQDFLRRIHTMPPVDTQYVFGRWHHDRVALGGIATEGRVWLKTLVTPAIDNRRILLIGRARSGTTLLTRLLNGHSRIRCDGEVLKRRVIAPAAYLGRLARKTDADLYGAKLLSYQMVQVHRIADLRRFRDRLRAQGFQFLHLVRETFPQTLSLAIAQASGRYHSDRVADSAKVTRPRATLDPANFVARVKWSEALLRYERAFFDGTDHLSVIYERDLMSPETQQATLDRICDAFDLPTEIVPTPLKKMLPTDPRNVIANYDAVAAAMHKADLGHLLPQ